MNIAKKSFLIILSILFLFGCNSEERKKQARIKVVKEEMAKERAEKKRLAQEKCDKGWAYGRVENGPHAWAEICPEYTACGGKSQSPVNLYNAYKNKALSRLEFDYKENPINFEFRNHTIVIHVAPDNYMLVKGKKYLLKQIHFHSFSEHLVDAKHLPMEMHFLHEGPGGFQATLAVFIDKKGKDNPFLKKYVDLFPKKDGEVYKSDETFDLNVLLPKNKSYFKYYGSLSEPPCTENMAYYVLKNPIHFSQEVNTKMNRILGNNFRNVQPIHERTISEFDE